MPVVFSNPQFPYQVGPNGSKAYVQELSFRQLINQLTIWNPNLDAMVAGRMINQAYREIIGKRDWYALKVQGSLNINNTVNTGQATAINGSTFVQGVGTNWTTNLIGLQFRIGFTYPYITINNVDVANQVLTLATPFGGGVNLTGGFNIVQCWVTLGANITRLILAKNQQQGWLMRLDTPQESIDYVDTWRTQLGWSTDFSPMPPTPDGQAQWEVWPTPYQAQVFPFQAYIQPPEMEKDTDCPVSFIRSDLIVARALVDAKLIGGRTDKYYDPTVAEMKMREFASKLEDMENRDNALDQRDISWDYGREQGAFGLGGTWAQNHDV